MESNSESLQDYFSIVMVGDENVGKTSILSKYCNNKLKFKDKKYDPLTFSGMGHKILRKNIIRRVNNDGTTD